MLHREKHTFWHVLPVKTQFSLRSIQGPRNFTSLAIQNEPSIDSDQTTRTQPDPNLRWAHIFEGTCFWRCGSVAQRYGLPFIFISSGGQTIQFWIKRSGLPQFICSKTLFRLSLDSDISKSFCSVWDRIVAVRVLNADFNLFMQNELFCLYCVYWFIFCRRGRWLVIIITIFYRKVKRYTQGLIQSVSHRYQHQRERHANATEQPQRNRWQAKKFPYLIQNV